MPRCHLWVEQMSATCRPAAKCVIFLYFAAINPRLSADIKSPVDRGIAYNMARRTRRDFPRDRSVLDLRVLKKGARISF